MKLQTSRLLTLSTMTIQLTPEQEELIALRMETGEYQGIEDVLTEAFQLLKAFHENNEAQWIEEIRPAIDAAYESTEAPIEGSTFINQLRQRLQASV